MIWYDVAVLLVVFFPGNLAGFSDTMSCLMYVLKSCFEGYYGKRTKYLKQMLSKLKIRLFSFLNRYCVRETMAEYWIRQLGDSLITHFVKLSRICKSHSTSGNGDEIYGSRLSKTLVGYSFFFANYLARYFVTVRKFYYYWAIDLLQKQQDTKTNWPSDRRL